jgi:hypothetical protein
MRESDRANAPLILDTLASELEHAGAMCDRLEAMTLRLVQTSRGENLQFALTEAQTVDALTQHLEELAAFARRLSAQAQSGYYDLAAAVAGVKLSDLADRLGGYSRPPEREVVTSGDLDLF